MASQKHYLTRGRRVFFLKIDQSLLPAVLSMMFPRWLPRFAHALPLRPSQRITRASESLVLVSVSHRTRCRELRTTTGRAAYLPVVFETEIRDGIEYKVPLAKQHMKELLAGRFPTNHHADTILLKDLPHATFRGIVNAFDAANNRLVWETAFTTPTLLSYSTK